LAITRDRTLNKPNATGATNVYLAYGNFLPKKLNAMKKYGKTIKKQEPITKALKYSFIYLSIYT
jgi:hypothetical protein